MSRSHCQLEKLSFAPEETRISFQMPSVTVSIYLKTTTTKFVFTVKQLGETRGYLTLWTGIDSAIVSLAVQGIVSHRTQQVRDLYLQIWRQLRTGTSDLQYIDQYYPNIGGPPENQDKEEDELSDSDSFRRVLRNAYRDSVSRVVAITAARPFTGELSEFTKNLFQYTF